MKIIYLILTISILLYSKDYDTDDKSIPSKKMITYLNDYSLAHCLSYFNKEDKGTQTLHDIGRAKGGIFFKSGIFDSKLHLVEKYVENSIIKYNVGISRHTGKPILFLDCMNMYNHIEHKKILTDIFNETFEEKTIKLMKEEETKLYLKREEKNLTKKVFTFNENKKIKKVIRKNTKYTCNNKSLVLKIPFTTEIEGKISKNIFEFKVKDGSNIKTCFINKKDLRE